MSTRSGKRIHSSFIETPISKELIGTMSERKTRSRKHKENQEEEPGKKKRSRDNYVSYPTDDEDLNVGKITRNNRKNTLKESNIGNIEKVCEEQINVVRETRRTKKNVEKDQPLDEPKSEKRKGRKSKKNQNFENNTINNKIVESSHKKSKNRKNKRSSLVDVKVDIIAEESTNSLDSYCTAAGSPQKTEITPTKKDLTAKTKETVLKNDKTSPKHKEVMQLDLINKDKVIQTSKESKKTPEIIQIPNGDFDLDSMFEKNSNLITSDETDSNSNETINVSFDKINKSTISITSDDSKTSDENIINTTPLLVESSLENSNLNISNRSRRSSEPVIPLQRQGTFTKDDKNTTLQREGTFTKDGPEPIIVLTPKTVTPRKGSLPTAGHTPYHSNAKKQEKVVNSRLTHSVEKPVTQRTSCVELVRQTKVMFCSPVDNPALSSARKSRVIKSSIKGSNKSFVFDDSLVTRSSVKSGSRKRSLTHGDAEDQAKRARLTTELEHSVNRLSRPRTVSAAAKASQPKEATTPSKKSTPGPRCESLKSKLPNFAALHQRRFDRMESLDECQERRAKRAKHLMSPTGRLNVLQRNPAKESNVQVTKTPSNVKKPDIPNETKTVPKSILDLKPGYTRFGFKVNYPINPFSVPKPAAVLPLPKPSLKGTTLQSKMAAKNALTREKSFDVLKVKRTEYRNMIKGVRTNRRFELQMRSRNIDS